MGKVYGGIEAGGTKFVCMVGNGPDEILAEVRFPTTSFENTVQQTVEFFAPHIRNGALAAVGIGSFGPIDLDSHSPTYGYITTTPKPGWAQVDFYGEISRALHVPVAFDTDVNAAAFGEQYWVPENHSLDPFLYMTVGTGIGVGAMVNNRLLHGLIHPEAGHTFIPHNREEDPFEGVCPYHGDCLEGLCTGPAMAKRWGVKAETLPADHPAWQLEAKYLAWGVCNLIYTFSPQRVVLGGGVFGHPGLIDMVRQHIVKISNGYVHSPKMTLEEIDQYVVPPRLGNQSGVLGAIALAMTLDKP